MTSIIKTINFFLTYNDERQRNVRADISIAEIYEAVELAVLKLRLWVRSR